MISIDGLRLIQFSEDLRLIPYKDSGGIWTVGFGSTKKVVPGFPITEAEAFRRLKEDLEDAEAKVNKYIFVTLQQCERDALISQAFNLSTQSFIKLSIYLMKDVETYLAKVPLYHKDSKGVARPGLITRRRAELLRFHGMSWKEIKEKIAA